MANLGGGSYEDDVSSPVDIVFGMRELCIHILKFNWATRLLEKFLLSQILAKRIAKAIADRGSLVDGFARTRSCALVFVDMYRYD